ncbi:MAG TPA: peptidoglycan-binding protein [Candidatus Omnitrophota bacterium]|nr:peptidoglycan-binding protein [Candidatus Omnitrophota bacterium]HPD84928.1 peptidoglycan-binding protein [Candidatus Omnitrophota bacterium]HRZ03786.1 peptidoglycan-binding protein [Candidatus Omnitrophota bacterium]
MLLRILLTIILAVGLAGCATTKKNVATTDQMEMRVSELESKLQERDSEIENLQFQLQEVKEAQIRNITLVPKGDFVKPDTKSVQTALKNAGLYDGPVDGKIGTKTKTAIKDFQKANGLKADGVVGQQTWMKLGTYLK